MVGNIRLAQIHRRLEEIFLNDISHSTFGNRNMLLFGDLLQVYLIIYKIDLAI